MKNILYFYITFLCFLYIKNQLTEILDSNTVEMIMKNDKLIYVNNETNYIRVYDIVLKREIQAISNNEIKKNKILIDLEVEKFIIIGIANNYSLIYNIYDDIINNNSPIKEGSFQIGLLYSIHFSIRKVTESIYILSYINDKNCNVFKLEFDKTPIGGRKLPSDNNQNVNSLECDSFDGEYVFCIYSLIEYDKNDDITYLECFYSFKEINNYFDKNIISTENPEAASIAKIVDNNEQKFILCYLKTNTDINDANKHDGVIYCQFFIQKGSDILSDNIHKIANTKYYMNRLNYENNIPIKIKQYEYSIFLFFDVTINGDIKSSLLYISTLDLKQNILDKIDDESKFNNDQNILINDKYRIIYKGVDDTAIKTLLEYRVLNLNCKDNLIYQFNSQKQSIDIKDDLIDNEKSTYFISFSIDSLTYLYLDNNERILGILTGRLIKNI